MSHCCFLAFKKKLLSQHIVWAIHAEIHGALDKKQTGQHIHPGTFFQCSNNMYQSMPHLTLQVNHYFYWNCRRILLILGSNQQSYWLTIRGTRRKGVLDTNLPMLRSPTSWKTWKDRFKSMLLLISTSNFVCYQQYQANKISILYRQTHKKRTRFQEVISHLQSEILMQLHMQIKDLDFLT